jgi:hypothetical protein
MAGLPAPGTVWAGLRIETELGQGGPSATYSARDAGTGRRVVVRAIHPDLGPAAGDRFLHEWALVDRLAHPRIVPVVRSGIVDGIAHVVTEYVDGVDLAEEIARSPLTLERAASVVSQVAGALDRAHRAGLVHGRLVPEAVLCAPDGHVVLTGFGGWADPPSPHHRPPEADQQEAPAATGDLYALGCLLHECLTGRVPFRGASSDEVARQHREAPRPSVTLLRPDLPPSVDLVVAEAMAVDPTQRYANARAMSDALRAAADAAPAAAPPGTDEPEPTTALPPVVAPSVFEEATVASAAATGDGRRRVVDGALYGVYEDEEPSGRGPAIVFAVIAVLALVVAALVWRAVNTDAELVVPVASSTTSTTSRPSPPTEESLRLLVPPGVDGCEAPDPQPADRPQRVELRCAADDTPRTTTLVLYATIDDRDQAFDDAVEALGAPAEGECVLGAPAVHDYLGVERVGRVACRAAPDRVDFVWTSDEAPLLLSATGPGAYAEHYRSWARVVDRIDAAFPLRVEQDLLDRLPDRFREGCERALDLLVEAGGQAATRCRPDGPADSVWWVAFPDGADMGGWIERRRSALGSNVFGPGDDACTPEGFGRRPPAEAPPPTATTLPPDPAAATTSSPTTTSTTTTTAPPPRPDAGMGSYDLAGRTGTILCFLDGQGRPTIVWVRDGARVGSVAVATSGRSMPDLLRWWEGGGHLP